MKFAYDKARKAAGFSLIEVVLVLALTSVILLTVSMLFSQTAKTLKFLKEKSHTVESAGLGCERLATELREAVEVKSPIPSGSIEFKKVKPSAPLLLNNPLDQPCTTWVRDYAGSQLATVKYTAGANFELLRTAGGLTTLVAQDVNLFQVDALPTYGTYKISLSLQEQRRVVVFETIVSCPAILGRPAP